HMDQMTQQNAAMVEQTSASVHALRGETGELSSLVGRFRAGASVRTPAPRAPVRQKVAVGARAPAPRPSDTWEEF
ncbi:MAG TPA: hypothetical protein PLV04_12670, partial [Phenylobacterium sp.]|nr:hypothetical protein [Phenylobacterium sp.]